MINELLAVGDDISDEIYVQLIVAKIRMTFPYKSKKELAEDAEQKAS